MGKYEELLMQQGCEEVSLLEDKFSPGLVTSSKQVLRGDRSLALRSSSQEHNAILGSFQSIVKLKNGWHCRGTPLGHPQIESGVVV